MKSRGFIFLAVLCALVLMLLIGVKKDQGANEDSHAVAPVKGNEAVHDNSFQSPTPPEDLPDPDDPRVTRLPDGRIYFNPSLEISRAITDSTSQEDSLAVVSQILDQYRYVFQGNPVGENSEITAQLLGKNPRKIIFIAPECIALRGDELTDTAGVPLFFHAHSATRMDVVSAGPDLELWTDDDLSTGD